MAPRTKRHDDVAVGYLRVSTDLQEQSPQIQRKAIEAWCEERGVHLMAIAQDIDVSGAAPVEKRPGLLEAMDLMRGHRAGLLVVYTRDRLARDRDVAATISLALRRDGARVVATDAVGGDESPMTRATEGIQDVFAELERALIRRRIKVAMQAKKERGECMGRPPYGFRVAADGVHLEENPEEAPAVQLAIELREQGEALRAIAERLDAEGFVPRGGNKWHPQTIKNITDPKNGD